MYLLYQQHTSKISPEADAHFNQANNAKLIMTYCGSGRMQSLAYCQHRNGLIGRLGDTTAQKCITTMYRAEKIT
jgi:hypothetical protein